MEINNSRYQTPVSYIFNKSNDDILENIRFIFIFLKNYTLFVDDFLAPTFMNDIYLKNWFNLSIQLYYLTKHEISVLEFSKFKTILENNGITFIKLNVMCEYLIENIF